MKAFVSRWPVATFVALTLGFQLAIVLVSYSLMPAGGHLHDLPSAHAVFRMRVFGPLAFAVGLTFWLEGSAGLRKLFGAFTHWKVGPQWYALGIGWKFLFTYLGIGTVALLGLRAWPGAVVPNLIGGTYEAFFALLRNMPFIVGIAIVEETSWMKFCVTRMQERYSAIKSCVIIGVCWGLWYLPMLLLGEGVPDGIPWYFFMLSMFSLTILLGWTYNMTRSGIVLLLMQIVSNCAFFIIPVLPDWWQGDATFVTSFVIVNFSMAMLILWRYGGEHLSTQKRAQWADAATAKGDLH
jgi:membrane protease YdiL (CAAX protease family)